MPRSTHPLGITLILEVGDKEKFISRYLSTAPEIQGRVFEHLLDGQQQLTALWRVFQNNYEWETFFIYLKALDEYQGDAEELMTAERPKGASIRQRGVLAVACRLGAIDFCTGERLDKNNIESRHYHPIFPTPLRHQWAQELSPAPLQPPHSSNSRLNVSSR